MWLTWDGSENWVSLASYASKLEYITKPALSSRIIINKVIKLVTFGSQMVLFCTIQSFKVLTGLTNCWSSWNFSNLFWNQISSYYWKSLQLHAIDNMKKFAAVSFTVDIIKSWAYYHCSWFTSIHGFEESVPLTVEPFSNNQESLDISKADKATFILLKWKK